MRSASISSLPGAAGELQDDPPPRLPVERGDDARRRPFRQGRTRLEARRERGAGADHAGGGAPRIGTETPSERRRATIDWRRSGEARRRSRPRSRSPRRARRPRGGRSCCRRGGPGRSGRPARRGPPRRRGAARRRAGEEASTTWTRRSASSTSLSVERNEATRVCGSFRRKPTVSERTMARPPTPWRRAWRGVERREEAVLGELLRGGEAVEERRLAGVRVADEGDGRDVAAGAGGGRCGSSRSSRGLP